MTQSESQPLRDSHFNNYGISRATTSRQAAAAANQLTMSSPGKVVLKIVSDVFCLFCVAFPILVFYLWVHHPYKRGFFCNDESLLHPFLESTISNLALYCVGFIVPIVTFVAVEVIQSKTAPNTQSNIVEMCGFEIPNCVVSIYKQTGTFLFGAACSQILTDIAKYSIGRLRPHFFAVCAPVLNGELICSNPANMHVYHTNYECSSITSTARMLKEMGLSFPSGHSSFSAYTMLYCAIYLQCRMTWRWSRLLKHTLQMVMIVWTWYTALSRISDYKHHWSDVLFGCLLGAAVAVVTSIAVSDLFTARKKGVQSDLKDGLRV